MNLNDEKTYDLRVEEAYDQKIDMILVMLEILRLDVLDISLNRQLDSLFRLQIAELNQMDDDLR